MSAKGLVATTSSERPPRQSSEAVWPASSSSVVIERRGIRRSRETSQPASAKTPRASNAFAGQSCATGLCGEIGRPEPSGHAPSSRKSSNSPTTQAQNPSRLL